MRYMGGKTRIAKQIAEVIDQYRQPGQLVGDAFCGGLSVSVALSKKGPVIASDYNLALISLHKAIQSGWEPPTSVSKEEYLSAKDIPDTDPLKAFCGFGCSFAGKWFGGYASSKDRNYATNARNSLLRKKFTGSIQHIDFLSVTPRPESFLIYCDIPYSGATGYTATGDFDRNKFIELVADWSNYTSVFVSEYEFPLGDVVFEKQQVTTVSRDKDKYTKATEKLFYIAKGSL